MVAQTSLEVLKGCSQSKDPVQAVRELRDAIFRPSVALTLFYASSDYDLVVLGRELREQFPGVPLIGCTSAGEITPDGYLSGALTGVSVAADDFSLVTTLLSDLQTTTIADVENAAKQVLEQHARRGRPSNGTNSFGFLLIDGLCRREESVVSALSKSLGDIQLFGGSAADGKRFEQTHVYYDGEFRQDAAVFTLVQTSRPFHVFKTQHFEMGEQRMVVTKADVASRTVTEINGVPAGREYARMVGLEVDELSPTIFATHPVVVRVGQDLYVRSIMQVNDDESVTFACAIDEGIVLSVATGTDLVTNLTDAFDRVREKVGAPVLTLGCDCLFRALEMEEKHLYDEVGQVMRENNVIGFSTYGEQFNSMHVNQTFTGVAIGA